MHIFRINIFDHSKIVSNSQEVYLNITRQNAEVGLNNIISFSYKNHLDKFYINGS
jgi:hypothetical protein